MSEPRYGIVNNNMNKLLLTI